jgi:hypothetical protein
MTAADNASKRHPSAALGISEMTTLKNVCLGTAIVLGLLAEFNGSFMLISPAEWYVAVPGVTTTGPYNQHFIRDIGLIFLFVGTSLLAGAAQPRHRVLLWLIPTLWLLSHAFFHFWEVAVGICGPSGLARDFPAVTLPAIIGVLLTGWAYQNVRFSLPRRRLT